MSLHVRPPHSPAQAHPSCTHTATHAAPRHTHTHSLQPRPQGPHWPVSASHVGCSHRGVAMFLSPRPPFSWAYPREPQSPSNSLRHVSSPTVPKLLQKTQDRSLTHTHTLRGATRIEHSSPAAQSGLCCRAGDPEHSAHMNQVPGCDPGARAQALAPGTCRAKTPSQSSPHWLLLPGAQFPPQRTPWLGRATAPPPPGAPSLLFMGSVSSAHLPLTHPMIYLSCLSSSFHQNKNSGRIQTLLFFIVHENGPRQSEPAQGRLRDRGSPGGSEGRCSIRSGHHPRRLSVAR